MLGVPSAAMQEMLLDPSAINHTDRINLIVPMEVPHSVLVGNYITLKLDGLVRIPNKRRMKEARRLRKVLNRRRRIIEYFLNGPMEGGVMGTRTLYIVKRTGFGRSRLNLHAVDAEERPEGYKLPEVLEAFGWANVITKKDMTRVGVGTTPREAIDLAEAEQKDRIEKAEATLKDAAKCLKRIREIRAEEYPKGVE